LDHQVQKAGRGQATCWSLTGHLLGRLLAGHWLITGWLRALAVPGGRQAPASSLGSIILGSSAAVLAHRLREFLLSRAHRLGHAAPSGKRAS